MKIEMSKKYTSNGESIRILCNDRNSIHYPAIGLRDDGYLAYFKENGESSAGPNYNLVEVWEPQEEEWCWFWDNSSKNPVIHLRMHSGKLDNFFISADGCAWENCAKFTGELPEHLKDKQKEPVYEWQYVIIYNGVATITEEFFTEQEFWDTNSSSDFIDTAYAIEKTSRIRK